MQVLKENVLPTPDKAIIVSQWSSLLKLVAIHLRKENVPYEQLDGSVPVKNRTTLVNNFNSSKHSSKVMSFFSLVCQVVLVREHVRNLALVLFCEHDFNTGLSMNVHLIV